MSAAPVGNRPDVLVRAFERLVRRAQPWHARGWERGSAGHRTVGRALAWAVLAWAHGEFPRSVGLVERCARTFPQWFPREGPHECRGIWHGYRLRLDCSDYYQRLAFLLRHYHETALLRLLRAALMPGDTFIDGGANNGLVSMLGAWRVGRTGQVVAFEPGRVREQLEWHVRANGLAQITVHPVGLSDREELLVLHAPDPGNSGAGTFAPIPARYGDGRRDEGTARLVPGDSIVRPPGRAQVVLKLDVEGFEVRALAGFRSLIDAARPVIITEVNHEMLGMAGTSARELWNRMKGWGYRAFGYSTCRAAVRQTRLVLYEAPGADGPLPSDLAWVRQGTQGWRRLERFMQFGKPA